MVANMHRKFNFLSTVEVEGVLYDTLLATKCTIFGFYKTLFIETEPCRLLVDGLPLPLLRLMEKEY